MLKINLASFQRQERETIDSLLNQLVEANNTNNMTLGSSCFVWVDGLN